MSSVVWPHIVGARNTLPRSVLSSLKLGSFVAKKRQPSHLVLKKQVYGGCAEQLKTFNINISPPEQIWVEVDKESGIWFKQVVKHPIPCAASVDKKLFQPHPRLFRVACTVHRSWCWRPVFERLPVVPSAAIRRSQLHAPRAQQRTPTYSTYTGRENHPNVSCF